MTPIVDERDRLTKLYEELTGEKSLEETERDNLLRQAAMLYGDNQGANEDNVIVSITLDMQERMLKEAADQVVAMREMRKQYKEDLEATQSELDSIAKSRDRIQYADKSLLDQLDATYQAQLMLIEEYVTGLQPCFRELTVEAILLREATRGHVARIQEREKQVIDINNMPLNDPGSRLQLNLGVGTIYARKIARIDELVGLEGSPEKLALAASDLQNLLNTNPRKRHASVNVEVSSNSELI